jgi:2-oxoisovalerate dehydrogenase E1 component
MTPVESATRPSGDATSQQFTRESILEDYRIAFQSRQASLLGRKEVLTGKAKFGIFGDGKEVPQLAMARAFRRGDFRSGYYRDQTFMFAINELTIEQFFAQLYAIADLELEPASAGRQMNCHFSTRSLDENGEWRTISGMHNTSSDISPTGGQMPRLVGLAYASKLYREIEELKSMTQFSRDGDEIAFGTIGNASCAEGMFWESINAAGVLGVPMLVSIWDDGYGISVPNEFQMTKGHVGEVLSGFRRSPKESNGFDIYTVKGWDYPALCETYLNAAAIVRMEHVPAIIHVVEVTQPQGHSTSGSHERYKTKDRLSWELEFDGLKKMREWIIAQKLASAEDLDRWESEDAALVRDAQRTAWKKYREPIDAELKEVATLISEIAGSSSRGAEIGKVRESLERVQSPFRRDIFRAITSTLVLARGESTEAVARLREWKERELAKNEERYSSHLHSETDLAALRVAEVAPRFDGDATVNGFEILNACFDAALARHPNLTIMGEDVGKLGDVNQGCAGLQEKYGLLRVSDTGIRECTIMGQAIGMAMRGLRPIAEIQYLDYILYGLQILSDDLATLRWRTKGGQKAPAIIRTRGHRLEGVWHSGSPMAGILNLVRGIYVCVPRNMTQAAGMYNTLLRSDDPAIVVEVLNGYRSKERLPSNIGDFTVALGRPEILREGADLTIVSYGATLKIVADAAELLSEVGIDAEIIDVQTLLPFDLSGTIVDSIRKTSRVMFVDEDVPGGATAFMMQQVLERGGYELLDSEPRTVAAKPHRPAYGSDGDYFSKPSRETIFEAAYELMHEVDPRRYPRI